MDKVELRKELNSLYDEVSDANFNDKYEIKEAFFRLLRFNENLINSINVHEDEIRHINDKDNFSSEECFVKGVQQIINNGGVANVDILRWYINLYRNENTNTEHGLMVRVLNDIFMEMKYKDIELTSIHNLPANLKEE